ncbi:MAG: hypothetical protein JWL69_5143 [Phycisphaerales bacterium]|nr:hypothetical protein [Phycisphaerales bacterium]MDB5354432.1 hypothetical protein [Phycisphaerales bacterium]
MELSLPPAIIRIIDEKIKAGHFHSREAVVVAAVLEMREVDTSELDEATIAAINEGEAQAARGEGVDLDAFRAQMTRRFSRP